MVEAVHRYFERAWNRASEEALRESLHKDFVIHGLADESLGLEEFVLAWQSFQSTLQGLRVDVRDTVVREDSVGVRVIISGTHVGDGFGIPPTGRFVTFGAQITARWDGRQFTEAWNIVDMAGALRQLAPVE